MGPLAKQLESVPVERPSALNYLWQSCRYGPLSLTFWKELLHLTAYYGVNHVKGLCRAHIGKDTRIRPTVLFRDAERIFIGDGCTINHNNVLWAGKREAVIQLGRHVMTGPNVMIFAFNHGYALSAHSMIDQPFTEGNVIIEDDVWIGAGCIILAGVRICRGVVLGAGSVVTRELPPYTICAGVPARVIKERPSPPQRAE